VAFLCVKILSLFTFLLADRKKQTGATDFLSREFF